MNKIDIFIKRLKKIGIDIELSSNIPWIYIHKINGIRVTDRFEGEHGFTIAFTPLRGQELNFTDIGEIFRLIRRYKEKDLSEDKQKCMILDRARTVNYNGQDFSMNIYLCSTCKECYKFEEIKHKFCPLCGVEYQSKIDISV